MPKSTKDSEVKTTKSRKKKIDEDIELKEEKKKTAKAKKATTSKTKKATKTDKEVKAEKKSTKSKTSSAAESKEKPAKAEKKETKTKTSKTVKVKAESKTKKVATKKASTSKTKKNKSESISLLEYYDLPYRYNQTLVKILVQTPENLFVYWDISDEDRKNLEETYGQDFFYNTKPVLIVHNETMNYSFEIDINDFANSWYLKISDPDCKYSIELGRRFVNNNSNNEYIYISSSNELITPNDHVLYNFDNSVLFKNIKTNTYFSKDINSIPLLRKLLQELFKEELYGNKLNNPSSMFF